MTGGANAKVPAVERDDEIGQASNLVGYLERQRTHIPCYSVRKKNRLLILAGNTTMGTQAAAEYVTRAEYVKDLIARLNLAAPGDPPRLPDHFHAVIKVKITGGGPLQVTYVTHHVLHP